MSVGEQLWAAILAALNTSRPAGVPEVKLLKAENVQPAQLPDAVLVPGPERARRIGGPGGPLTEISATFWIWWRAAGDGAVGPVSKVDAMRTWAVQKLERQQFGGLAVDCELAGVKDWEFAASEKFFGRCQQQFELTYTHRVGDPTLTA